MFNQKGQAFSVFELMIAAIVAVAILFVLLTIIGGGLPSFNTTPKEALSNAFSAVEDGGQTTSQEFFLNPGQIVTSTQFDELGFDQHSIAFAIAGDNKFQENKGEVGIEDGSNGEFTYFKYLGSTAMTAKAVVFCDQTGDSLEDTLAIADDAYSDAEGIDNIDICGGDEYQPCCAVIIIR